jgi:hypothetical protein
MKLYCARAVVLPLLLIAASQPVTGQDKKANAKIAQSPGAISTDHRRLADYFRDLAAQEKALAESYDRMAKIYAGETAARELTNEFQRLAETEKRAAASAEGIAACYRDLATKVESTSAPAPENHVRYEDNAFRR